MKTAQVVVGVALVVGSTQAFLPGSGMLKGATRSSAMAPMRMQQNSPGDKMRQAADNVKDAGKQALNKAENAADRTAQKADAKASQVSSSAQARTGAAGVGGAEIRAQDVQGKEVVREAPLEAVHIHENTEVVDKTKVEEERIKTQVVQKVQPIHDEETRAKDVKKIDHGTEVRHHGKSGLDAQTKAELEARRQQLAQTTDTTHEATKTHISERPEVVRNQQTRVIEQVVPVLDKDVYIPHREEHEKKVVEVYHEAPELVGTKVEQTISKEEFEKKYGTKVDTPNVPSPTGAAPRASTSTTSVTGGATSAAAARTPPAAGVGASGATAANTNISKGQSAYITEHQKQQQHASSASGVEDDKVPYSMSSSNMAKDAEESLENDDGSGGIVSKVKNVVKKIVE